MYDIVIIGGGIVGLVNALLLAEKTTLRIAILEAKSPLKTWSLDNYDLRVYALTPATQRVLNEIGIWQVLESKRLSPFTQMTVWDSGGGGEIHFDHRQLNVPALGYIVEENLLHTLLLEKIKNYPQIELLCPIILREIQEHQEYIELGVKDNTVLNTQLLIGADGAKSWVREKTQLPLHIHDYQHSALIAQVQTELPHDHKAQQCFLSGGHFPAGPLAFLPLKDAYQSSIVWSTLPEKAAELLAVEESAFQKMLGEAFGLRLGKIVAVSKRAIFPLYERHAQAYVKDRVALIGDAAHTLHPLAGQGVNLGIADAASLAQVVIEAVNKGREFSSKATLRRYERARKGNNAMMLTTVKLLKAIFSSDMKGTQFLRSQGLIITNKLTLLKSFFARYAMG